MARPYGTPRWRGGGCFFARGGGGGLDFGVPQVKVSVWGILKARVATSENPAVSLHFCRSILEPQSRLEDNSLKSQVFRPQNGTAVLNG